MSFERSRCHHLWPSFAASCLLLACSQAPHANHTFTHVLPPTAGLPHSVERRVIEADVMYDDTALRALSLHEMAVVAPAAKGWVTGPR